MKHPLVLSEAKGGNAVTLSRSIERSASRSISSASERETSISLTRPSDDSAPVSPNVTLSRTRRPTRRSALMVAFQDAGGERKSEIAEVCRRDVGDVIISGIRTTSI